MSLKWYQRPRLIALDVGTSVLEAARAIESNHVGAVVVQDKGAVVGIVTDRDLTIRVVGRGLDPKATQLANVMTSPVVTLTPRDSQADAIRVMQERNVRRVPLVEGDHFVGIVTLDDLLLDEAAPLDQLGAIVYGQLGEGGPVISPRSPAMMRRAARAEATYCRFIDHLRAEAGFDTAGEAETALEVVLKSVVRRLTRGKAKNLIAQLPSLLQATLLSLPPGPDKLVSRESIEGELSQRLAVDRNRASQILAAVGTMISDSVSAGHMTHVQSQLPSDLRGIFGGDQVPAA